MAQDILTLHIKHCLPSLRDVPTLCSVYLRLTILGQKTITQIWFAPIISLLHTFSYEAAVGLEVDELGPNATLPLPFPLTQMHGIHWSNSNGAQAIQTTA